LRKRKHSHTCVWLLEKQNRTALRIPSRKLRSRWSEIMAVSENNPNRKPVLGFCKYWRKVPLLKPRKWLLTDRPV